MNAIESASAIPWKHAGPEAAGGAAAVPWDEPAQDPGSEDPGLWGSELPQVQAAHHGLLQTAQGEPKAPRRPQSAGLRLSRRFLLLFR